VIAERVSVLRDKRMESFLSMLLFDGVNLLTICFCEYCIRNIDVEQKSIFGRRFVSTLEASAG
jgi:hypothetical protein